jgi:hypothetical protein
MGGQVNTLILLSGVTPITYRSMLISIGFLWFLSPTPSGEIKHEIRQPAGSNKIRHYRDSPDAHRANAGSG